MVQLKHVVRALQNQLDKLLLLVFAEQQVGDGVCAASVNYLLQNKYMSLGSLSNSIGYDLLRTILPSIIPSSYRGATIRYLYYIRCMLSGQSLVLENGHSHE
ncbi:uncharacterized protein LOC131322638 isoform X4 [Rhododendron vialii]|uniref:uncharacterized protein LOC131322638 isoform X4 n=1 Tax=Rhododendron vialii TaxID=182163 RepID=UPI00265FED34|nr:uncharacterized protein LOC131322638 isoform X4 [Rhododendron vialii]